VNNKHVSLGLRQDADQDADQAGRLVSARASHADDRQHSGGGAKARRGAVPDPPTTDLRPFL